MWSVAPPVKHFLGVADGKLSRVTVAKMKDIPADRPLVQHEPGHSMQNVNSAKVLMHLYASGDGWKRDGRFIPIQLNNAASVKEHAVEILQTSGHGSQVIFGEALPAVCEKPVVISGEINQGVGRP